MFILLTPPKTPITFLKVLKNELTLACLYYFGSVFVRRLQTIRRSLISAPLTEFTPVVCHFSTSSKHDFLCSAAIYISYYQVDNSEILSSRQ